MDMGPHRSRDEYSQNYHLMFPSRHGDAARQSCAPLPTKVANKHPNTDTPSPLSITLSQRSARPPWLPHARRSRLHVQQIELHQRTCLHLNTPSDDSTESDLCILPDFDDWELDGETPRREITHGELVPLFRRAASANRERLRARLEGDGWDFVGGKYGQDDKALQEAANSQSEESVDDEFDLVVLPVVRLSC